MHSSGALAELWQAGSSGKPGVLYAFLAGTGILVLVFIVVAVKALRSLKSGEWATGGVIALGAMVGAILGFLVRPSVPLIGQLPFSTVVTNGIYLNGLDALLRSAAAILQLHGCGRNRRRGRSGCFALLDAALVASLSRRLGGFRVSCD